MSANNLKFGFAVNQQAQRQRVRNQPGILVSRETRPDTILAEDTFRAMLLLERRRAERSRKPFVLMLLSSSSATSVFRTVGDRLARAITSTIRESDLIGWYDREETLGVIFTEVGVEGNTSTIEVLQTKVWKCLRATIAEELTSKLQITFHLFPENWADNCGDQAADRKLYPDIHDDVSKKRIPIAFKRVIDVIGSAGLLLALAPLLALIAAAIRLNSKGPVIFRQQRLGQFGKRFDCLKFRTMYANNDPQIHREYVQSFIAGNSDQESQVGPTVYKIKSDPRVTTVGRLLRKTSLDELPQFWNVLRGEMSLVGPRPPVPYEFEVYDFWHRRRVLEVKPGVTGLWQVSGRSRTCFDDMVRLDLRYSQEWSLWLDLKILLATPLAVLTGDGAF